MVENVSPDTRVKVYVFDSRFQKKPFGGWGDLYIMDYPTKDYVDLLQVEKLLCECEGVTEAHAYTFYGGDNVLQVGADVAGIGEAELDRVNAYLAEHLKQAWIPAKIVCVV